MTSRSDKQTGGPAFPHTVEYKGAGCAGVVPHGGMTLRDYFAAKAMHAFLMRPSSMTAPDEVIAEAAYDTADAMIKARNNNE